MQHLFATIAKKNDTLLLSQYIRVINKVPARPGTIVISKEVIELVLAIPYLIQ